MGSVLARHVRLPEATAGGRVRALGPASVAKPVFEGPGPVWPTLGG